MNFSDVNKFDNFTRVTRCGDFTLEVGKFVNRISKISKKSRRIHQNFGQIAERNVSPVKSTTWWNCQVDFSN